MDALLQRNKNKPHPYSTKIGELIKRSTDCSINQEDLGMFLTISDMVNASEDVCKDALKAIRLRLSSSIGRSQETLWLTLVLIEILVKNGTNHLHLMVLHKDFLADLNRILLPKYQAPISHQNKVLHMLEDWIKTLAGVPGYKELYKIYKNLKDKRIYELANESISDSMDLGSIGGASAVGSISMWRSGDEIQSYLRSSSILRKKSMPESLGQSDGHKPQQLASSCVSCKSIRAAKMKLLLELDTVTEDVRMLQEMVQQLHPASLEADEARILGELYRTCQSMYGRLTRLASKSTLWEDIVERVLEIVDASNVAFHDFDNFLERVGRENAVLADVIMYESDEKLVQLDNQQALF